MTSTPRLAASSSVSPDTALLLVVGLLLLLAILAVIVWLQWSSSRSNREQSSLLTTFVTSTLGSLQETTTAHLSALREQQTRTMETVLSQLSSESRAHREHLSLQTQDVMTMLTASVNRVVDSSSSTAKQMAELVASSQAMIATKDPMAFQQVRGATFPFSSDGDTAPYTSTEDLAQIDAERAQAARAAEAGIAAIMNLRGVGSDEPYPAAGSGFDQAAAAAQ